MYLQMKWWNVLDLLQNKMEGRMDWYRNEIGHDSIIIEAGWWVQNDLIILPNFVDVWNLLQ